MVDFVHRAHWSRCCNQGLKWGSSVGSAPQLLAQGELVVDWGRGWGRGVRGEREPPPAFSNYFKHWLQRDWNCLSRRRRGSASREQWSKLCRRKRRRRAESWHKVYSPIVARWTIVTHSRFVELSYSIVIVKKCSVVRMIQ